LANLDRKWPADQVERRPVEGLIPYARNARTHSAEQVAAVAASIREWGWTIPALIDEEGNVLAGHCRILAARKLGLADIPVMVAAGWSDAQKRAYILADNQLTLIGGWDFAGLSNELRGLDEWGFDVSLCGFDEADFGRVTENGFPALPTGDRAPFQEMTFTVHDEQVDLVKEALALAKARGPFDGPNENSNGNALARICAEYLAETVDA